MRGGARWARGGQGAAVTRRTCPGGRGRPGSPGAERAAPAQPELQCSRPRLGSAVNYRGLCPLPNKHNKL